jgi:hypothetical protein
MNELEKRVVQLEKEVRQLKVCHHEYEEVGGRNTNYRVFFNGTNAYIRCRKCGHRDRT